MMLLRALKTRYGPARPRQMMTALRGHLRPHVWVLSLLLGIGCGAVAHPLPVALHTPLKTTRPGLRVPRGWIHGQWKKGWHHGRYGWWWRSQHRWYFYLTPFEPYPPYYGSGPIPLTDTPAPDFFATPLTGTPSLSRWYCLSPPGFYPFVTSCSGGWTEVVGPPPP